MTEQTMGQRIAAQRKQLGISQEALGEKMGVSRQAISKWESDGAVPEIDKLILLSRLFGVTVGWLLGVEEPAQPAAQKEDTLTEQQLYMVEEIVRKYQNRPQKPSHRRWPTALGAAAIVVLGILLLGTQRDLQKLSARLNTAEQIAVGAESAAIINDSRLSALEEARYEQSTEALLADYTFEITPHTDDTAATVTFSAVPGRWQEGDQGYLSIRQGEQELIFSCSQGSAFLTVAAELAIDDGYELCFTQIHADGTREQQPLRWPDVEDLRSALSMGMEILHGRAFYSGGTVTLHNYEFTLSMPTLGYEYARQSWNSVDLVLRVGGEELCRFNLLGDTGGKDDEIARSSEIVFCQEQITFENLALPEGEGLELWFCAELGSGLSDSVMVDSWRIGPNGLES